MNVVLTPSSIDISPPKRYDNVNLDAVYVRKAITEFDFETVGRLREAGFSRIARKSPPAGLAPQWIDDLDTEAGVFSLLGYNGSGKPVATMRVQDSRVSTLELSRFVPLDELLPPAHRPAAQFARLSVVKDAASTNVMFGIFKAAWIWCLSEGIPTIVLATPPWSKHIYDSMFFDDLGVQGHFSHEFAGGATHVTMRLPVFTAGRIWRSMESRLCKQFLDISHPALILEQRENI